MADYRKLLEKASSQPGLAAGIRLTRKRKSASLASSATRKRSRQRRDSHPETAAVPKKKKARKLSKAARREIALRNLAKARRKRFKVKRVGKKRFGRNKGEKIKVLTVSEKRRGRRRKKRVSSAQRAAARRNIRKAIAANRRKGRSHTKTTRRRHRRSKRRKNPILNPLPNPRKGRKKRKSSKRSSGRSKSRKRSAAAKKAWRTRKARAAARRGSSKRRGASKRKHHRKSPKRVAAARKAAATRRERKYARRMSTHAYGDEVAIFEERRRGRKHSKRRHHRRHYSRRRNPLPLVGVLANPIGRPMQFLGKAVSLGIGYLWEDAVIRYASTHALTGTGTVLTDQPAAGQIYNSEAPLLPLWSDYTKLAISVAGVAAPLIAGRFVARDFMNHAFLAAAVRFFGKLAVDATAQFVPQMLPSADATTLRLYGAEAAAQARLAQVNVTPAASAPAATFAGLPKGARAALPPASPSLGLGDCPSSPMPVMSDPLAGQRNMLAEKLMTLPDPCQPPINLTNGFAPDAGGPAPGSNDGSLPMMTTSIPAGSHSGPGVQIMTPQPSGQTGLTPQPQPSGSALGPSRTIVPGTLIPSTNPAPYVPR